MTLTAGEHVLRAEVSGAVAESRFEIVATPTGLADLILTSGARPSTIATLTTLLGRREYRALATYANTPAAQGLTAVRRQQIATEANALATQ
jgi:glycerophosphoryl diester phosphodiesterase